MTGPQQKFCDGIVPGLNATDAYRAAHPKASPAAARAHGARLVANGNSKAEIARMRALADSMAGSAVLTLVEKRKFLARLVRARVSEEAANSDLWQSIKRTKGGIEYRLPDRLAAIRADCDLAGDGSEAGADDALSEMLKRAFSNVRTAGPGVSKATAGGDG